ncbi:MAG: N-acetylglucosamine-6-phosphate deacetylase [Planctomycetota bacterium]|jgi:N-acetylglucosamine-6-phosphate deacetylase
MTAQASDSSARGPTSPYVDLQINGLAGIDFNAIDLSDDAWEQACLALYRDGTERFLPTLITDSIDALDRKLRRLGELVKNPPASHRAIAEGIHLEGPFLSPLPGYIGAHPSQHARDADIELLKRWQDRSQGQIRMVTLAPERDPSGICTRWLADQGILVAAGHTDATMDQLQQAIDQGLTLFTHLGNACPMRMHRHDNIIHRALSLRSMLRYTMIADGHHLPSWLLEAWIDLIGVDRVAIVSDAISAAGLPAGMHRLGEQVVAVGKDGVPRSPDESHFVGSGMTLGRMDRQLSGRNRFPADVCRRLFRDNAAAWLDSAPDQTG